MRPILVLLSLVFLVPCQSLYSLPTSTVVLDEPSEQTQQKNEKRFSKKIKKIGKKVSPIFQKMEAEDFFGGVTDEPKFKWGMLLVALGLILRFLFGVKLAVLLVIAGIIFMIIALVNY